MLATGRWKAEEVRDDDTSRNVWDCHCIQAIVQMTGTDPAGSLESSLGESRSWKRKIKSQATQHYLGQQFTDFEVSGMALLWS